MEEIDSLRMKNLQLLEKLKRGQSEFRSLVVDSGINITSDFTVQPDQKSFSFTDDADLNRRIEEMRLSIRPITSSHSSPPPYDPQTATSYSHNHYPRVVDDSSDSLDSNHSDGVTQHSVVRNTSTPTLLQRNHALLIDLDTSDDNGEPQTSTPREYQYDSQSQILSSSSVDKFSRYKVATPKSILKNRKLIDDNISLDNSSLYKYKDLSVKHLLNGSSRMSDDGDTTRQTDDDDDYSKDTRSGRDDSLRSDSTIKKDFDLLREITKSPKKNVEFNEKFQVLNNNNNGNNNNNNSNGSTDIREPAITTSDAKKSLLSCRKSTSSTHSSQNWKNTDKTLLGYDWISDVQRSKSDSSVLRQGDEFFTKMSTFRKTNKAECETDVASIRENRLLERAISPEIENPSHTCIHGYTINERLFTVPTNADQYGRSVCTVCLSVRKPTTDSNPGFMRVSVPKNQVNTDIIIKPHRRNSYDPSDSCALTQHTVAGYETNSAQFISQFNSSTMDLKHAVIGSESQQIMTSADIDAELEEHSRSRKLGVPDASSRIKLNAAHIEALNSLKVVD